MKQLHIKCTSSPVSRSLSLVLVSPVSASPVSESPVGPRPQRRHDGSCCYVTELGCEMNKLRDREVKTGKTAEFLLRHKAIEEDFSEVRVAVVGNMDAGKSTLLGVLNHGALDHGRGTARLKLFRHKHEADTGRTSSVGNDILGFNSKGSIVNKPDPHTGALDWTQICKEAAKVLTFIDLAGHEKYLKTTVFGMTGHAPDFAMLMIGSNAGIVGMTKEHLGLALALNVPLFFVVNKIDMFPANNGQTP